MKNRICFYSQIHNVKSKNVYRSILRFVQPALNFAQALCLVIDDFLH